MPRPSNRIPQDKLITAARARAAMAICAVIYMVVPYASTAGAGTLDAAPTFERDVLPIFTAHCLKCHGREARKASLDMRTIVLLSRGGESGPVLKPGSIDESPLFQRISDRSMPPEGELPLTAAHIETVRRWISSGAAAVNAAADDAVADNDGASEVSAADREYWAFRKPAPHGPPTVRQTNRVRTPIDAFVLARLEERGLGFAPDADPHTLVRRAYFDLLGLPPSPQEVDDFVNDQSEGAYERLLDRLFASPHFGERWGRHWLDAAGYVDVQGGDNDAGIVKLSEGKWRYRDYVIRSFNDDKPLARFLTEQLAGDELDDWRSVKQFTPEMVEHLVATTFLRCSADDTDENELNTADIRHGVLARTVETVASNLLGLTVNCARCHSHKYDPIPHRDYYQFTAIFTPAFNSQAWLQPRDRALADISPREKARREEHNAGVQRLIDEAKSRLAELRRPYEERLFEAKLQALPEAIRADTKAAVQTAAAQRNEVQKYLASKFEGSLRASPNDVAAALSADDSSKVAALEAQLQELTKQLQSWGKIQAVYDVGPAPATYLLVRGNDETPGVEVDPGFITVLSEGDPSTLLKETHGLGATSGRRLALARWLTERDTPAAGQVARVMANRVWQQLFGAGIVETTDNFGHSGAMPTHPELLDWLALRFIDDSYRWKSLIKLLIMSTVYRQASALAANELASPGSPQTIDPGNQLLWRQRLRRLESEVVRDRILATSGKLDLAMFGPAIPLDARSDGAVVVKEKELPSPTSQWRRSLYILGRRNYHLSMLGVFDQPVMTTNCTRRNSSAVVLQSLAMLNDDFVIEQAGLFADRVAAAVSASDCVATAFRMALAREPSAQESLWCHDLVSRQYERYRPSAENDEAARRKALAHLCQMLLGTSEFLYVE